MSGTGKKVIKTIKVNADKCHGCRACEVVCSAFHAEPRYSSVNPARARIRVIRDPLADIYLPVHGGEYAAAECAGRDRHTIGGKQYEECAFCRASCPSRDAFKEPDSGLPLKCDMCESDPTLEKPLCVQWCLAGALEYEEREDSAQEDGTLQDLDLGVEALADRFGWDKLLSSVARQSGKA